MLREHVPESFDPKRFAKATESIKGCLPLDKFSFPAEVLAGSVGEVGYELRFGIDSEGYVYIHGFVDAVLNLECQRCLKPVEYPVHAEFSLSPVRDETEANKLPERYEAILMEQDKLSVLRIVEEELILSLPIAPMHDEACYFEAGNSLPPHLN